jgi:hypothetical protein
MQLLELADLPDGLVLDGATRLRTASAEDVVLPAGSPPSEASPENVLILLGILRLRCPIFPAGDQTAIALES